MSALPEQVGSIAAEIATDRQMIDACLDGALGRFTGRISGAAAHLVRAGGKRARPLLSCAVMRALGVDPAGHGACIISSELIHTASLLHDDLVDGAASRRGVDAVHRLFDPGAAVMAGDLLMAEALQALAAAGQVGLVQAAAGAVAAMSRGQVLEAEQRGRHGTSLETLREINQLKTASLIAYSAEVGARLAQAAPSRVEGAARFGRCVGEAFQLVDDLLDWTGDEAEVGKPTGGQDLLAGKVTVPLRLALDRDPGLALEVQRCWRAAPEAQPHILAQVTARVMELGALDRTRQMAEGLVHQACAALERLPASAWTDYLASMARRSLQRRA